MIYGTVKFSRFDADLTAELTEIGWRVTGFGPSAENLAYIARALDLLYTPGHRGPAEGDPIYLCVTGVAQTLDGTCTITELQPAPADAIF